MPRSHTLPYFAAVHPAYGQNLVEVAKVVAGTSPLRMIDIGANIGDSALQIMAQVDSEILCIEGDPLWARFLRVNASNRARLAIDECFVVVGGGTTQLHPVRHGGTSELVAGGEGGAIAVTSPEELLTRHSAFRHSRLIKSDTDGYDTSLIVGFAAECRATVPVLFFEYDPSLAMKAGDSEPWRVWRRLAGLGYAHVFVWDNFGSPMGVAQIAEMEDLSARVYGQRSHSSYDYWDVAVVHLEDSQVSARLRELMSTAAVGHNG